MATRDPKSVDAELVELVGELSRRAGRAATEVEVRAALASLLPAEEKALRRMGRGAPPATPLGPMAWADLARGVEPSVAAARELGGYYQLLAERDALVAMVGPAPASLQSAAAAAKKPKADERPKAPGKKSKDLDEEPSPPSALPETPARKRRGESQARAQHVLGLFAYHRDAPRVAQALKLSLNELEAEIDELGVRRKANRLISGLDSELPVAQPTAAPKSGPPLRRSLAEQASVKAARDAAKAAEDKARAAKAAEDAEAAAKAVAQVRPVSRRVEPPREQPAMPSARRSVEAPQPFKSAATHAALARKPVQKKAASAETNAEAGAADPIAARPAATTDGATKGTKAAEPARLSRKAFATEEEFLKAVLAQVGARREKLRQALGLRNEPLPEKVMLARFRAAGLDRELGLRERDLLRGLFKRHHGMSAAVGAELKLAAKDLAALLKERGLDREVEALREAQRREARAAVWPQKRIELLLQRRGWLADLGVLREIEEEVRTRVRIAWAKLRESDLSPTKAVDLLGRELQLKGADARALSKLLKLG